MSNFSIEWHSEFEEEHPFISFISVALFSLIAFVFPILSIVLIPWYIRSNRLNKKRDEKDPLFPLINYLYRMNCVAEPLFLLVSGIMIVIFYLRISSELYDNANRVVYFPYFNLFRFLLFSKLSSSFFINVVTAILAIYRSILCIYPKITKLSLILKKHALFYTFALYILLFLLGMLFAIVNGYVLGFQPFSGNEHVTKESSGDELLILYFVFNGFIFVFTGIHVLYLILRLKTSSEHAETPLSRFFTHLIVLMFSSKFFILPTTMIILIDDSADNWRKIIVLYLPEIGMSHLITKMAYFLSHNKSNTNRISPYSAVVGPNLPVIEGTVPVPVYEINNIMQPS